MNSLPTISVVTPSLNQCEYIDAAVDSVLEQVYPALDYLLLDGGSTDGALEILASYGERLNWISEPDIGQAAAVNRGWRGSRGDILGWLNSDDCYMPGALQLVGEYFHTHPHVDMIFGDCDLIDDRGRTIGKYETRAFDYPDFLRKAVNYIPQPAVFLRREMLEKVGYLSEHLHYVMDFEYWLRAGLVCQVEYLPIKLAALRVHQEAKSLVGLSELARELVEIYNAYFSANDIPESLLEFKQEALAHVNYRAADCAFWYGDSNLARQFLLSSWMHGNRRVDRLSLCVLIGKLGLLLAQRITGNPYHKIAIK